MQANTIMISSRKIGDVRESQFELLRIVAQWCIVLYHLFMDYTIHLQEQHPIYLGIQIPLHIGVLLFVLISGYWGIKPTIKGLLKLITMIFVYFVPLAIIGDAHLDLGIVRIIKDFLIVSYPRYWFFRCYLFLFLFSPVINYFLENMQSRQRFYLLAVLGYMSIWVGTSQGDITLSSGKNLTNFLFLYVVGNTLRVYKGKWSGIPIWKMLTIYLLINISIVGMFMWS